MRANPFESQLERLARTLVEQFGVQVICQGDNAWTDGKQIVLPSVPEPMEEALERMMLGYLDHEMAHVAFSDFQVAAEFEKKHPGCLGLLNVVEDALIERRAMQRWPGVRANLDAMFSQVRDRVISLIAQRSPFERFCTAIYLKLAHHRDMLGLDRVVVGYEDLLDRFPQLHDTRDAARLAADLLARWRTKHSSPPRRQQSESGSSSPDNQGQQGSPGSRSPNGSSADNPTPPDRVPGDGTESDATPHAESNDSAESSTLSDTDQTKGTSGQTEGADGSMCQSGDTNGAGGTISRGITLISEALADAIREQVAQLNPSREYRAYTRQLDRVEPIPTAEQSAIQQLLQEGTDVVRRLRRGLANALRSAEKRWWRDGQDRGDLSPRTLHRLCMDRPSLDVFRKRAMIQGRATAVCLILDASGSMSSRKMDVARQAMRVLLEALTDLRIATEAFTFTTGDRFSLAEACRQTGQDQCKLQERFGRFGNLEIGLIKRFDESVKAGLARLPSVRGTGLTPLGEAMQVGGARIITRRESRKIVVVLTDGKAGCEGNGEAATFHSQHIAQLITRSGIELVGVGIQDDSLRAVVPDTIVIQQIEELPAQLCKLLGRTLKKGLSHVG